MAKRARSVRPKKGQMFISVLADGETWTEAETGHGCHVAIVVRQPDEEMGDADDMQYLHQWEIRWRRNKDGFPEPYFQQVL